MYSAYERRDFSSIAPSPGQNVQNSTMCFGVCNLKATVCLLPACRCVFLEPKGGMCNHVCLSVSSDVCGCVTSGLRVALLQAGQMGPWREKAMGKRLVLFWQAWSSHTNQPYERHIRRITSTNCDTSEL